MVFGRTSNDTKYSRPLIGFLILALITAIGLPLVNAKVIYPAYSKILISTITEEAGRLARHIIPPSAKHSKLSHSVLEQSGFTSEIYRLENELGLLKIKVYSPTGLTLYSTNPMEIGTIKSREYILDSTARVLPCGEGLHTNGTGVLERSKTVDTIRTCVPIIHGDTFLGAFELTIDVSKNMKQLDRINAYATYGTVLACCCILVVGIILLKLETSRIRERKQTEKLKADVEQITRHDIKSPLIGALNGIEYLRNYTTLDDDQRSMLTDMRTSVHTGLDLINRSLDIYKMETGTYQYEPKPMDILAMTRRVAADLSGVATFGATPIMITLSGKPITPEDSLQIMAEESLCYSTIANLMKNAIEASHTDDHISIDFDETDVVTIAIHNSGTVPPRLMDTFFNKYATAAKKPGTGLGTYSAKLMTEAMGGSIAMRSSEEDGTTVTVILPKKSVA